MTCCNESYFVGSDVSHGGLNAMNFIVTYIKAGHFAALDDIHSKITRCFCKTPGHPVMLGNAATRLVSSTMNRVTDIRANINDGYQLLHFFGSEPLTVDAVEGICIKIAAFRSHITY